jgi:hypothetical protein
MSLKFKNFAMLYLFSEICCTSSMSAVATGDLDASVGEKKPVLLCVVAILFSGLNVGHGYKG